jgi:hypothetical protein
MTMMVSLCLALSSVGVSVTVSTFVRMTTEDCNEESKCEVEGYEATHKTPRPQIVLTNQRRALRKHLSFDSLANVEKSIDQARPLHRIGSGIGMRC